MVSTSTSIPCSSMRFNRSSLMTSGPFSDPATAATERASLDDVGDGRNDAVRVGINRAHPAAADADFPPPRARLQRGDPPARQHDSGTGQLPDELSAAGHMASSPLRRNGVVWSDAPMMGFARRLTLRRRKPADSGPHSRRGATMTAITGAFVDVRTSGYGVDIDVHRYQDTADDRALAGLERPLLRFSQHDVRLLRVRRGLVHP